ncbi:hypothetical protein [Kitasatospora griseola]|uniref:hypothetical protein n=1 Tax=Kitasatospora griseola TaxID=2064 RepID=UPI003413C78B
MPSPELAVEQLATLQALHMGAVAVAAQPVDPFTAPDTAEAARRESKAAARAASLVALSSHHLSEVLELVLDTAGQGRPPTSLELQYAEQAYRSASDSLGEAARRLHLHTDHLAGRPDGPRNQFGAVRRAAARLRSAMGPAATAAPASSTDPAVPTPAMFKPSPRR